MKLICIKLPLLLILILQPIVMLVAQNKTGEPVRENDGIPSATIACGIDTIEYPLAKASGMETMELRKNNLEGLAQWYEVEGNASISGVTIWAKTYTLTGTNKTNSVTVNLYVSGPDSLPQAIALATASATVDTTMKAVRVPFLTALNLNGDFMVSIEYGNGLTENDTVLVATNMHGDGKGENLTAAFYQFPSGNAWANLSYAMPGEDRDAFIFPWVNISLTTGFDIPLDTVCQAEPVLLTNTSTFFSRHYMYNRRIESPLTFGDAFTWDFGDGMTSAATDPDHLWLSSGYYTIGLTARHTGYFANCAEPVAHGIQVADRPIADFTMSNTNIETGDTLVLTNASSGSFGCVWDFGDGQSVVSCNNQTHVYDSSGVYFVSLTVMSPYGCEEITTHQVTVSPTTNVKPADNSAKFSFWPNPAQSEVNLSFTHPDLVEYVEMKDLTGRTIAGWNGNPGTLSVAGITNGVYLLHVRTSEGGHFEKLQISK